MTKYFDIQLTNTSRGTIEKDKGRVVITDAPDPPLPPDAPNNMIWDCVYDNRLGTSGTTVNITLKPDHEYALGYIDNHKDNEQMWSRFLYAQGVKDLADGADSYCMFGGLDANHIYKDGKLTIASGDNQDSRIFRIFERPINVINDPADRTNPADWELVTDNAGTAFQWEGNYEYYYVCTNIGYVYNVHLMMHDDWHGTNNRIDHRSQYIKSGRYNANQYLRFDGGKNGGDLSDRSITSNGFISIKHVYRRPIKLTTVDHDADNTNEWRLQYSKNADEDGFGSMQLNFQENREYLFVGLDTAGRWEIGTGVAIIEEGYLTVKDWGQHNAGMGCVVGDAVWVEFTDRDGVKKVLARNGRLLYVYWRPLQLSEDTCTGSAVVPVAADGNWSISNVVVNPFEDSRTVNSTPIGFVSNAGVGFYLNKGLVENGGSIEVGDSKGSILLHVMETKDSRASKGDTFGVLQVANFDYDEDDSIEFKVTRNFLSETIKTFPDQNTFTHTITESDPVVFGVDEFKEGLIQFDVEVTVNKSDGSSIVFQTLPVLVNKTTNADTANEYYRANEKLF